MPNYAGIEEYVLRTFVRIRERFEQDRPLIPPGHLYEVRYEDLVQDPLARRSEIYQRLELGDSATVRPKVERFLADSADYKTNRYSLTDEQRRTVAQRWAAAFESHGYEI